MSEAAVDRVVELSQRLEQGDLEALREYLARDFYTHAPGLDEMGAADRITDLATGFQSGLPDLTASLTDVRSDGEDVTATLNARGTHSDELWNVPGSGAVIEWSTPVSIRAVGDRLAIRIDETTTPKRVGLLRQLRLVNPADEMDLPPHYPHAAPDFLLKLVLTGAAGDKPCAHLDQIHVTEPTTAECGQCVESGEIWPALRMCLVCGFVGCCDTSKGRHMAGHHADTGHSLFRSINGDEGWIWCYDDDAFFERNTLERYR